MSEIKLNREYYEKLIREDLEWLNKNTSHSLERSHIVSVLKASVNMMYPGNDAEELTPEQHIIGIIDRLYEEQLKSVDYALEWLDDTLRQYVHWEYYSSCDYFLDKVDVKKLLPSVIKYILTITLPVKSHLTNRDMFYEKGYNLLFLQFSEEKAYYLLSELK